MTERKKITVLGAGESGCGAAVLARKQGFDVFLSDSGQIKDKYKAILERDAIEFEEGTHTGSLIYDCAEIIKSPGIPDDATVINEAVERKIPVISEIEFASRYTDATKVCITGTNGKTTTTLLTHHIMQKAGLSVGLAGNVGKSFAMQVAEDDKDYYVLELSSFQLDGLKDFKAEIAIMLNITPDHLDRYDNDMEKYVSSKFRIVNNQGADDAFIYCADDPVIVNGIKGRNITSAMYPFSIVSSTGMAAYSKENQLYIETKNQSMHMSLFELALQGKHNLYNSLAAGIATRLLDIRKEVVRESLSDFRNIEHRLEYVMSVHGIDFINDSKATNVNSTWYALESMDKPVVWIVGGVDKGNDYEMLLDLVRDKVKGIVCLGIENKKIMETFGEVVSDIREACTASEAVQRAYELGRKGDAVLLSPACASFDLFKNYEDRGWQFKNAVRAL
jgi:UDP-N-acetylmuramoylalanine--D-glutamate ligase